jgi:hypothetical protein
LRWFLSHAHCKRANLLPQIASAELVGKVLKLVSAAPVEEVSGHHVMRLSWIERWYWANPRWLLTDLEINQLIPQVN